MTRTPDDIAALVADRENTHGDFAHSARITQSIKGIFRAFPTWPDLDPCQREALEMIACKMGRILAGDPNHTDHWADIAGYARLASRRGK